MIDYKRKQDMDRVASTAQAALDKIAQTKKANVRVENAAQIVEHVCQKYELTYSQIFSKSRLPEIVYPRMLAMILLYEQAGFKQREVAKIFNKNQVSTIAYALSKKREVFEKLNYKINAKT